MRARAQEMDDGAMSRKIYSYGSLTALIAAAALSCGAAQAEPLFAFLNAPAQSQIGPQYAPTEQNDANEDVELDPRLQRQVVDYASDEAPGTVIIDTPHTFLYFVLGNGKAIRYGIGVGRQGFTWSGVKQVSRNAEWPDWYPPAEMIARQPYLPRMVAGGPAIHSAPAPCISAAPNIESTARTIRPPSPSRCRAAASASPTTT